MIIAPILILTIGGFVYTLSTIVADTLAIRDTNTMVYDTQGALDRIEQDARLSVQFLSTSGPLPSPQGSDSNFTGTAAFTSSSSFNGGSNALIMSTLSTNLNPLDPTRQAVYFANQPNACDVTQIYNAKLLTTVIYYINNGSLYRRTYVPTWTTTAGPNQVCNAPWQQDSCSPGYTNTTMCQTSDAKIIDNVTSLSTAFYSTPDGSGGDLGAAAATTASTINVTLATSKTTAGQPISNTASVRATKLNSSGVSTNSLAFTTQPSDTSALVSDTNVTITSLATNSPTYAWQRSTDGGSTWSNITGATNATLTIASVDKTWDQNKFRVIVTDQFGKTLTSSTATLTVNTWGSLALQNNWTDYGSPYSSNGSTLTSSGVVMLKGLIKRSGTPVQNEIIGTLPNNARPSGKLMFETSSSADTSTGMHTSRIDINTDGTIHFIYGDAGYLTLEGINFMASNNTFTAITPSNGWVNYGASSYGDTFASAGYFVDSVGRTHTQGVVKNGTVTDGTQILPLPAALLTGTSQYLHIPDRSSGFGYVGSDPTNGIVAKGNSNTNTVMGVNTMFYPGSTVGWANLTLTNGWVAYGGGFASPQYIKGSDGIVTIKGLIKSGTVTDGTVIATLPAGYCPKDRTLIAGGVTNAKSVRYDVRQTTTGVPANGCSIEIYYGDATWASLDAITYLAEQ
jgi:hypothetical protein